MSSKMLVPVSDFAAFIARLERVEAQLKERLVDGVYKYGPCLRCGYGPWDSSSAHEPRCCPRCHSAYWDRPPRKASARRPEDPPLPGWKTSRQPKKRAVFAAPVEPPVVEAAPTPARPSIMLPPELRPPGEPLIPPPPRAPATTVEAATTQRTVDNPMNVRPVTVVENEPAPTVHVAALPDAVVEAVLAGQQVTYEDIKAAKDVQDEHPNEDLRQREGGPGNSEAPTRPVDANLQAKKDAFFADAIASGLVSAEPAGEAAAPTTPFVADTEAPSLAPKPDDDPFWK